MMVIVLLAVLGILFLMYGNDRNHKNEKKENTTQKNKILKETEEIARLYEDIYVSAKQKKALAEKETIEAIIERLGQEGLIAVDMENHIDMVNYEDAENYLKAVEEGMEERFSIYQVLDDGGFVRQDFTAKDGAVDVTCSSLTWEGTTPKAETVIHYRADIWKFTGNYLFFSYAQPDAYDGPENETAVRIRPLSAECRNFTETYVEPVGYIDTNMYITDWDEEDFDNLDFYDVYENLYYAYYGEKVEYQFGYELESMEVDAKAFEAVYQEYFQITPEILREHTIYHEETNTYEYRPRGMDNSSGPPCTPQPEVVDYEESGDLIKLKVSIVWAEKAIENAYVHELTVRKLPHGRFQYVSNRVLEKHTEPVWYVERK